MSREVIVAGVQFTRHLGDKVYNFERSSELITAAQKEGATIVALPELFSTGYFPGGGSVSTEYFAWAESIPGEMTRKLSELAKKLDVVIIAPLFEIDPVLGLYYNSAAVVSPDGIIGKYRKRHIPSLPHMIENYYFSAGDIRYPVFDVGETRIGISICYDRHFPETFRLLTLEGAEVVFSVNNTPTARSAAMWNSEISVAASSNGIFIVQNNCWGEREEFFGKSFIANPVGEVIAQAGEGETVVTARLDLQEIRTARLHYGSIRDVRWSDFGLTKRS